jgi:hypothetical protein
VHLACGGKSAAEPTKRPSGKGVTWRRDSEQLPRRSADRNQLVVGVRDFVRHLRGKDAINNAYEKLHRLNAGTHDQKIRLL